MVGSTEDDVVRDNRHRLLQGKAFPASEEVNFYEMSCRAQQIAPFALIIRLNQHSSMAQV